MMAASLRWTECLTTTPPEAALSRAARWRAMAARTPTEAGSLPGSRSRRISGPISSLSWNRSLIPSFPTILGSAIRGSRAIGYAIGVCAGATGRSSGIAATLESYQDLFGFHHPLTVALTALPSVTLW
jgi:hypothetical protein